MLRGLRFALDPSYPKDSKNPSGGNSVLILGKFTVELTLSNPLCT